MVFGAVWVIALQQQKTNKSALLSLNTLPEMVQVKDLQKEAQAFNQQLFRLKQISQRSINWSNFLGPLTSSAVFHQISIERLSLGKSSKEIRLQAVAPTKQQAIDFSQALEQRPELFAQASLPLASLSPAPGGVAFSMTIVMVQPSPNQ
jgi:hypothetical protein